MICSLFHRLQSDYRNIQIGVVGRTGAGMYYIFRRAFGNNLSLDRQKLARASSLPVF